LNIIRIIYRLTYLLATNVIFSLIGFALNLFFSKDSKKLQRYIAKYSQKWARRICASLNIEITVQGEIPEFNNALIVANHVGSPDIFILGSCFQVVFVSKEEVRDWPLIGFLANLGHTIFVNREKKQKVRETILSIKDRLNSGFSVLLFPEARVTDGNDVYPFKSAHFEAAILSGKPVLPVMIHYEDSENPKIARWGNQNFISHIISLLKNPKLKATVTIFPLIPSSFDRKDLSIRSHELIQNSYNKIVNKSAKN
jgi:1-acyl-sn-glycerol-3-phosphate acyltransferase